MGAGEEKVQGCDFSDGLRSLMQAAGIPSYRALAERAGVSRWQVRQLRAGQAKNMRVAVLVQLAEALKVPLSVLLSKFGVVETGQVHPGLEGGAASPEIQENQGLEALRQEYRRLQGQMEAQAEQVRSQLHHEALQTLESWLVQWPTIAARAEGRADLPAAKILPFVRPVEQLMTQWGVEAIAPVDAQVPYDPQNHQLVGGTANPGETVQVTHSGRKYRGNLLHRAKVKPI